MATQNLTSTGELALTTGEIAYLNQFLPDVDARGDFYLAYYQMTGDAHRS